MKPIPTSRRPSTDASAARALGRVQQAREEARARLLTIVNTLPILVYSINRAGIITMWEGQTFSDELSQHLSPVGQSLFSLVEDRAAVHARLQRVFEGETVHLEHEQAGHWVESWSVPARDSRGRCVGLHGVAIDITERKRADAATRETEGHLRAVVNHIRECLVLLDRDLRYLWCNPAFAAWIGIPRDEVKGRTAYDLVGSDEAERLREGARSVMKAGTPAEFEEIVVRDGQRRHIRGSRVPIPDRDGKIVSMFTIFSDITDRRALGEQLAQSQKMEAIGTLAGGVAHDFNNYLTVINGYSELLAEQFSPEDALGEAAQEIRAAAARAADLTQQLLAFSRKQIVDPRSLDLNRVVADMERMLRRLTGVQVDLRVTLGPALGAVIADTGQMQQVVMNLVLNARDAMPEGGVLEVTTSCVTVAGRPTDAPSELAPGDYVRLTVSDTGVGMDAQTKARLFEPFFTTKPYGRGTGLGLSTVYGIVHQSGGAIAVSSEPGHGATFSVFLPRASVRPDVGLPERPDLHRLGGHETVLLAEDDAQLRRMMAGILRQRGYVVLEAADGSEALAIADRHRGAIHLLVADVVMPGLSGPDLAGRMTHRRRRLRVLLMSGYADGTVLRSVQQRRLEFLAKPFDAEQLLRKVRRALARKRPRRSPAQAALRR
jgi:PAS domain S-box-containing protein